MRLHSTTASFLNREVTALAIIESAVAFGITLLLAWRGRWLYLGCASVVAPLLMLRTSKSTERGVRWFATASTWYSDVTNRTTGYWQVLSVMSWLPILVLVPLAIKIASTVTSVFTQPLDCLSAIPRNWFAQTFCIDTVHPPEMVPGSESVNVEMDEMLRFSGVMGGLKELITSAEVSDKLAFVMMALAILPPFALSFLYRLAVKGTAIVWLPLLWIVPKLSPKESVLTRLKLLNKSSWGRLTAFLSLFTIAAFLTKIVIYEGKIALSRIASEGNLESLVRDYVAPTILPPWQIASVINAAVAMVMFLWAGDQIIRLQDPAYADRQSSGDGVLRTTSVLRAVLSIYTTSCLVYMAIVRAQVIHLPPLSDKLFPWSN